MSQNDLYGNASSTRTMIGLGLPKEPRSSRATQGREGSLESSVQLFNWGRGLGPVVVREFTRQALKVAALRHPHVVPIVDAGSTPDGTPFAVAERLSGATLEERAGGTLIPLPELLPILRGVGSGLAAAHAAGIAHLELRADNVFMAAVAGYAYGFPKLLGFGVSALTAAARAGGLEVAALSPGAVPPEQRLGGGGGDARSDQYALAALAYRFLAVAELTPAIELTLTRAMAWHPDRRFDSMSSFLEALGAAVRAQPEPPPSANARPDERAAPSPLAPVLEAGALTQQFFAEGDRMDSDGAAPASAEAADVTLSVPERVPRSRAQMLAAFSLALVSLVIVGWTAVSLSNAPRWQELSSAPRNQAPPIETPAPSEPAPRRTASMALRALQSAKVAARPIQQPTQPPPMSPPPPTVATTPTPPAPAAEPAVPTPPPIDEGANQPPEELGAGPSDETPAAMP